MGARDHCFHGVGWISFECSRYDVLPEKGHTGRQAK